MTPEYTLKDCYTHHDLYKEAHRIMSERYKTHQEEIRELEQIIDELEIDDDGMHDIEKRYRR